MHLPALVATEHCCRNHSSHHHVLLICLIVMKSMLIGNDCLIDSQHLILKFKVFADKQNLCKCWQRLYYLRTLNGLCNHFPPLPTETCCVWSINHPPGEGLSQAGAMWTFWKMLLLRILYSLLATCLYWDWPRLMAVLRWSRRRDLSSSLM